MTMVSRMIDALLGTRKIRRVADENSAARQKLLHTLEQQDVLATLTHRQRNRERVDIAREYKNGRAR